MKPITISILLLCTLGLSTLKAQNDIVINYKTFADMDSSITRKDVKDLKKADKIYFSSKDTYQSVLPTYLSLYKKTHDFSPLNWRIAISYLHSDKKHLSLTYLQTCDSTISPLYQFYLAKAYHFNSNYEAAKQNYEAFRDSLSSEYYNTFYKTFDLKKKQHPFDQIITDLITACEIGLKNTNDSINISFENFGIANESSHEIAPVLTPDNHLYFASDRLHEKYNTFQIYEIQLDSITHFGPVEISSAFPYVPEDNRIPLANDTINNGLLFQSMEKGGNIMIATKKGEKVKAKPYKKINSNYKEGTACYIGDSALVFSSTRDPRQEYSDLYITLKNEKNKWEKPIKIGGEINTAGEEEVITFYNGDLYYISNGPGSIGGFDIFKSTYQGNNQWDSIQNLGSPINTAENDLSFIPINDSSALYCGIRPDSKGGADLYKVTMLPYTTTDSLGNIVILKSSFVNNIEHDLFCLDSIFYNPDIINDPTSYDTKLDSLLNKNNTEDILKEMSDSLKTIDIDSSYIQILTDTLGTTIE